jgi:hypothetical protein
MVLGSAAQDWMFGTVAVTARMQRLRLVGCRCRFDDPEGAAVTLCQDDSPGEAALTPSMEHKSGGRCWRELEPTIVGRRGPAGTCLDGFSSYRFIASDDQWHGECTIRLGTVVVSPVHDNQSGTLGEGGRLDRGDVEQ